MRLVELITESRDVESTGLQSADNLVSAVSLSTVPQVSDLPVKIEESEWQTLFSPTRLFRKFNFSNSKKLKYFINELLAYQERYDHHASILIEGNFVSIETYTHDIETVTKQDQDLASFCDEVYEDTRYFK